MQMRYLGIDYGEKRIGLALSDEQGDFSYPLSVIQNSEKLVQEISNLCKENNVSTIVIGESKNFNQEENPIMKSVKILKENLENETQLPVHLHPEFMTSLEAERLQGHNDMHDASAAAIILKSYLETKK
jgi:putative Holliday junction resolvase